MCEDERVSPHLEGTKSARLQETLASHRQALALNSDNLDVQFNTGQVLGSLAETLLEDEADMGTKMDAGALLGEAVEFFTNCLAAQQRQYEQLSSELAEMQKMNGDALPDDSETTMEADTRMEVRNESEASPASESAGEWATVEEALTPEVILETCTAQLGALTTLLGLYELGDLSGLEQRAKYVSRYIPFT